MVPEAVVRRQESAAVMVVAANSAAPGPWANGRDHVAGRVEEPDLDHVLIIGIGGVDE